MEKLVRNRLLLLVVLTIGLSLFFQGTQIVYANVEEEITLQGDISEEKTVAIKAANDAISRITEPQYVPAYEESFVQEVTTALALVEIAREEYGARDEDFFNLAKLKEAENRVLKFMAIKAARDAIDAIPPESELTDENMKEYIEAVTEARRLVDIAMQEYGATYFDICWRLDLLERAEKIVDEYEEPEPEPEPKPVKPDDRLPTPPTGGFSVALGMGLFVSGIGLLFMKQRQKGRK